MHEQPLHMQTHYVISVIIKYIFLIHLRLARCAQMIWERNSVCCRVKCLNSQNLHSLYSGSLELPLLKHSPVTGNISKGNKWQNNKYS